MFLTKKIHDQKNIPQIILKESTAHLGSYTFLQETLVNIKTCHFHSSINHQEQLFHRTLTLATFVLLILQSCLQRSDLTPPEAVVWIIFLKIGIHKVSQTSQESLPNKLAR